MSFIERELQKIEDGIRATPNGDDAAHLRIAQQSLRWATDPDCYASPSSYLAKFHGAELSPTDGTGIVTKEPIPAPLQS